MIVLRVVGDGDVIVDRICGGNNAALPFGSVSTNVLEFCFFSFSFSFETGISMSEITE